MGKNRDLIQIMILVLIGMFIPFLGSMALTYGLDVTKIALTFVYFLVIFGVELGIVFLYFSLGNKLAEKKMDIHKPK